MKYFNKMLLSSSNKILKRKAGSVLDVDFCCLYSLLLLILLLPDYSFCMEMLKVDVPRYTEVGSRPRLYCNYKLNKDTLYSVKWYKDGSEFYRYVPKDNPPSQVFKVPWVRVDRANSNAKFVTLKDVSLGSSGLYTCEASSEAPRFKTVNGNGKIQVLDLPDTKPVLDYNRNIQTSKHSNSQKNSNTGLKGSLGYRVGDVLDVNCTSPRSKPPATLKWYINNERPDAKFVTNSPPMKVSGSGGLYTAKLRLHFQLKRHHFIQGHVTVKCTASIYTEYFESNSLSLPGIGLGEKALGISGRSGGISTMSSYGFSLSFFQEILFLCIIASYHVL